MEIHALAEKSFQLSLKRNSSIETNASEMQALINPRNLPKTQSKSDVKLERCKNS